MKKIHILIFLLGFLLFIKTPARAASLNCNFQKDFENLKTAQNNADLDYADAVKAELQVRKDILSKIVACGSNEIQNFQSKLNIQIQDGDIKNLRYQLSEKLNDAQRYYDLQKSKIDGLGIRGSQDMAKDIKEWRISNYLPLSERIVNLLLWNKNQELFATAQNRFTQISRSMNFLNLTENEEINGLYKQAQSALSDAEKLNGDAKNSLGRRDMSSSDSSLLIKNSLEALSKTYDAFSALSDAVKKSLMQ